MTGVGMMPAPFGGDGGKAMRYRVELVGRQPGAIGKEQKINLEVEAINPEEAREKTFNQYEVWAITKVEEVNNG